MRIAIVHPFPAMSDREGNASSVIVRDRALASLLEQRGHSIMGLRTTRGQELVAPSVDDYTDWMFVPIEQEDVEKPGSLVRSQTLVDLVCDWAPDVVMVKGAGSIIGRELFQSHNGPFVAIIGGGHRDRTTVQCELALTEDSAQERFLAQRMGRDRILRLSKLANGCFRPPAAGDDKVFDAVVVSGFTRHKNHAALLPLLDADISIVFVGDGDLREGFAAVARAKRARCRFTGWVDTGEVADLLRSARVLLHPSTSEGFPRAVVEAMASGIPPICMDGVVGSPLESGYNGVLVHQDEFAATTLALLRDPGRLKILGVNARFTYEQCFSLEVLENTTTNHPSTANTATQPTRPWHDPPIKTVRETGETSPDREPTR